jgi:hypothetical protein
VKRLLVLAALLVAAAIGATGAAPKTGGHDSVVATTSVGLSARMFLADAMTLKQVSKRSLTIPFDWTYHLRSPDGSLLALDRRGRIEFVRLDTLRSAGSVNLGRVQVRPLMWLLNRTLLVQAGNSIAAIDPKTVKVLWRKPLGGTLLDAALCGTRGVLLIGSGSTAAPARVALVGARGSFRTAVIERVYAGSESGQSRSPGLAVDLGANRAWVVGADEPIAEVDLSGMTVGYTVSRPLAKVAPGPTRHALALGDGRLAVVGTDGQITRDASGNVTRETLTPSGLVLVDTGGGAARMIQPDAADAVLAGGSVLTFGAGWDTTKPAPTGAGVTVWGVDGTLRAHLFGAMPIYEVQSYGGLAYVTLSDRSGHIAVVDGATGKVLRIVSRPTLRVLPNR